MKSLFVPSAAVALALAIILTPSATHAQTASEVLQYSPGTGGAAGYDNPAAALGEPSRVTPGQFGGPVDPLAPPYLNSQVVSIGTGGSLTVRFSDPILNNPSNPFGLDFLVFGNSGFAVTNAFDENFNYIGTPATDGSLFGSEGTALVSVSADGVTFFTLSPELSPALAALFPTDGIGDFGTPANPGLNPSDFAGLTLAGIRALYAGSGGGSGYDLDWARDTSGAPVTLGEIQFVRVEVTQGKMEIDGFSGVATVPEPGTWALFAIGLGSIAFATRGSRRRNPKPAAK